ncbi:MAG: orotate phosphoribosyltransferase [Clostridiales Family XIII bacterium]|jgi:orotate phosphoribosyltransferase|nr:orotate phosphoribosyltransferase [Clostridiales Family XIII bacterium]
MQYKDDFIRFMVRSGVLLFGDFTTKSGRKTPYFINTGNYRTGAQIAELGGYYAACIRENMENGGIAKGELTLFGPAYKGIPLAVSAAIALSQGGTPVQYCFNRKEAKDHGEGGEMIGCRLKDGDQVLITEDVVTAGTAVRECLPLLKKAAAVLVEGLIISVDRMERGAGDRTAIQELLEDYGIRTFPIVTVRDIIECLHGKAVDGKVYIDDAARAGMEAYMAEHCAG